MTLETEAILRRAIRRRDELNVFIRLLMNWLQGRDFDEARLRKKKPA